MPYLQELIHKVEEGPWFRHLRIGLAVLAVVGLVVGYNWRSFKNFNSQEAMDSAQLARNIAEGKGYTTLFVRPLSMHLLKKHAGGAAASGDPTRIKGNHPDLANPPVYPGLLAVAMKVLPLKQQINLTSPFWSQGGMFWRHQPDFLIALVNEQAQRADPSEPGRDRQAHRHEREHDLRRQQQLPSVRPVGEHPHRQGEHHVGHREARRQHRDEERALRHREHQPALTHVLNPRPHVRKDRGDPDRAKRRKGKWGSWGHGKPDDPALRC